MNTQAEQNNIFSQQFHKQKKAKRQYAYEEPEEDLDKWDYLYFAVSASYVDFNVPAEFTGAQNVKGDDLGYKFSVGCCVNKYLSFEASFVEWGSQTVQGTRISDTVRSNAILYTSIFKLPLGSEVDTINIYTRLGVAAWKSQQEENDNQLNTTIRSTDKGNSIYYGIGTDYTIIKDRIALFLEYAPVTFKPKFFGREHTQKLHTVDIGFRYRF